MLNESFGKATRSTISRATTVLMAVILFAQHDLDMDKWGSEQDSNNKANTWGAETAAASRFGGRVWSITLEISQVPRNFNRVNSWRSNLERFMLCSLRFSDFWRLADPVIRNYQTALWIIRQPYVKWIEERNCFSFQLLHMKKSCRWGWSSAAEDNQVCTRLQDWGPGPQNMSD